MPETTVLHTNRGPASQIPVPITFSIGEWDIFLGLLSAEAIKGRSDESLAPRTEKLDAIARKVVERCFAEVYSIDHPPFDSDEVSR